MKKTIAILSMICFLWLFQPVLGNPAGIVLYMSTKNGAYLLLADHSGSSKRGWGAFGGKAESNENPKETAARETHEETRGYFKKEYFETKLKGKNQVIDGKFHMFFLEIDFVSACRITNNNSSIKEKEYNERGPYAWIPYSELKKYLISNDLNKTCLIDKRFLPKGSKRDYFWKAWVKTMTKAYETKSIPWEKNSKKSAAPERMQAQDR